MLRTILDAKIAPGSVIPVGIICEDAALMKLKPVAQTATRVDARMATIRNRYILEHSERGVFAAIDPNGALSRLVGECPDLQCQVLA